MPRSMAKRRLSILDVGHGNSAVLEDSRGVVVIDSGPGSSLLEFLVGEGIGHVDVVLISHSDEDHIAGLVALLSCDEISIGRVHLNTDSEKGSAIWDDLVFALTEMDSEGGVDFHPLLVADSSGQFDQGEVHIEIVGPSKYLASKGAGGRSRSGRRIGTNSISAVIRLSIVGRPVALFTGDLDRVGLEDLMEWGADGKASILVFPHHGGGAGFCEAEIFARGLCEFVEPALIVFSIGRGRYDTPRPEVVSAIREWNPHVRIACTQLSDHCANELPGTEPGHLVAVFARGRYLKKCCAGTIVVNLDDETVLPLYVDHQQFIEKAAPTALCLLARSRVN